MKIMRIIYNSNHIFHRAIGIIPNEMQNKKNFEVEYITETIAKQNEIENLPGYKLYNNDYVRLIDNKKMSIRHRIRYNVTPYYYKVSDIPISNLLYPLMMVLLKTVSWSDVIPIGLGAGTGTEIVIKEAKTIGGWYICNL
ncbi:MAG: hypothetical protein Ta2E_12530 [Mycoplasmoidaceae bacterium]|nr:MAG: hypothetical protein Ta2E_12530 [Mycoplasmoidaceae bacterium]